VREVLWDGERKCFFYLPWLELKEATKIEIMDVYNCFGAYCNGQ